jgi:hypothetical protein
VGAYSEARRRILWQSALYSRYRETSNEPTTARTNVYTCLCMQESNIAYLPYRVQGQVARLATPSQGVCRISGRSPRDRGPPSVPEASRLLVLPVATRRRVLTDNTWRVPFGVKKHHNSPMKRYQDAIRN